VVNKREWIKSLLVMSILLKETSR